MAVTTAATTTISTSLFAVAALCLFLSCFLGSLQSPVLFIKPNTAIDAAIPVPEGMMLFDHEGVAAD